MTTFKRTKPIPQYTPGPWQYEPYDCGDPSVGMGASPAIVYKEMPDGTIIQIAEMQTPIYLVEGKSEWHDDQCYDGSEDGNARLIAAAPTLLKALKAMAQAYKIIMPNDAWWMEYQQAMLAIEEAEGRTER